MTSDGMDVALTIYPSIRRFLAFSISSERLSLVSMMTVAFGVRFSFLISSRSSMPFISGITTSIKRISGTYPSLSFFKASVAVPVVTTSNPLFTNLLEYKESKKASSSINRIFCFVVEFRQAWCKYIIRIYKFLELVHLFERDLSPECFEYCVLLH